MLFPRYLTQINLLPQTYINKLNFKLMALKITQNKEIFSVSGIINTITAANFKKHISLGMKDVEELVIDIEHVTEIDSSGMKAMRSLYADCMAINKRVYIVGTGCKEVYDDLYVSNVA